MSIHAYKMHPTQLASGDFWRMTYSFLSTRDLLVSLEIPSLFHSKSPQTPSTKEER